MTGGVDGQATWVRHRDPRFAIEGALALSRLLALAEWRAKTRVSI